VLVRLDQLERERSGTQHAGQAVGAHRVVPLARAGGVEHPTVGQGQVDLDLVRVPFAGHRLDADAGHPDLGPAAPNPGVDRLPHLRIVGALAEHGLPILGQTSGQVDTHDSIPPLEMHR